MKNLWSNKYVGLPYQFGGRDFIKGTDCLRLLEEIYRKEKNYAINIGEEPVTDEWYNQNPDRLIEQAITHGEVINDVTQLREFDAVFFKMNGGIRHVGVMIDKYGYFVHQLQERLSRVDTINARHWERRFYCAIRPNFSK